MIAVDALATYRLVRLAQQDTITRPVRERYLAWCRKNAPGLADLAWCPWCLSMWVAAAVVIARRRCPALWAPFAATLAYSATAGLTDQALMFLADLADGDG